MEPYFVLQLFGVFLITALAGVSRCLKNGDFKSVGNLVSVALFSGCLGFGCICLFIKSGDGDNGIHAYHLGIAAIIGLAGKAINALPPSNQPKLLTVLLHQTHDKLRVRHELRGLVNAELSTALVHWDGCSLPVGGWAGGQDVVFMFRF